MIRIELSEKIRDIDEEEKRLLEELNIEPKKKGFKWRKVWLYTDGIFSLKEVNEKESIVEFNDSSTMVVKGGYEEIKLLINKAEEESEDDLELD